MNQHTHDLSADDVGLNALVVGTGRSGSTMLSNSCENTRRSSAYRSSFAC